MFCDLVREHRIRLGLTQEGVAELTGVSPRSIRSIENGRTTRARAGTVRLLATAFELAGVERAAVQPPGPEALSSPSGAETCGAGSTT